MDALDEKKIKVITENNDSIDVGLECKVSATL